MIFCPDSGKVLHARSLYLGTGVTNNQAEYRAFIAGLQAARAWKLGALRVEGDSELVVDQMTGVKLVRNGKLRERWSEAKELLRHFDSIEIFHIGRERNKTADKLSTMGITRRASSFVAVAHVQYAKQPRASALGTSLTDRFVTPRPPRPPVRRPPPPVAPRLWAPA